MEDGAALLWGHRGDAAPLRGRESGAQGWRSPGVGRGGKTSLCGDGGMGGGIVTGRGQWGTALLQDGDHGAQHRLGMGTVGYRGMAPLWDGDHRDGDNRDTALLWDGGQWGKRGWGTTGRGAMGYREMALLWNGDRWDGGPQGTGSGTDPGWEPGWHRTVMGAVGHSPTAGQGHFGGGWQQAVLGVPGMRPHL